MAPRSITAPRGRRFATVAVLAAVAVAGGGCGDDGSDGAGSTAGPQGVGPVRANSTAQFADCRDWRRGTEEERYATIADIRGQLTPQRSETAESDLPDEVAYGIFEKTCSSEGSDSLRLYKLYAPAQAFAPLRSDLDEDE